MKTIDPNKLFETKVRIYNLHLLDKMKTYFEQHRKSFRNKNEFYNYLIMEGLSVLEKEDKDSNYYYLKSKTLEEKIDELIEVIKVVNKNLNYIDKSNFITMQENQILLTRIYNSIFSSHKDLNKEYYDVGFYDDLPDDFKDKTKLFEELYDHYGRFKIVENESKND